MRTNFFTAVAALALAGLICAAPANAEDSPVAKDNHTMGKGMGMDKMNMESMKGMMHECMGMNKDRKMCDQDMMQKCQKEMSKGECDKMMKQAKAQDGTSKKK